MTHHWSFSVTVPPPWRWKGQMVRLLEKCFCSVLPTVPGSWTLPSCVASRGGYTSLCPAGGGQWIVGDVGGMVATSWNTGDTYPTLHYRDSWQNSYHVIAHCYHIKTIMMSYLHHYPHWLSCINLVIRAINQSCMFRPIGLLQLQHHSCYNHSADCEGSGNRLAIFTYHCIWLAEIVFWYG